MKIVIPTISQVLVFKNGVVKVVKTLILPAASKFVMVPKPPYALRGSFWTTIEARADEEPDMTDCRIVSVQVDSYEPPAEPKMVPCTTWKDIACANVGVDLAISATVGSGQSLSQVDFCGRILETSASFFVFLRKYEDETVPDRSFVLSYGQIVSMHSLEVTADGEPGSLSLSRLERPGEVKSRVRSEQGTFVRIDYSCAHDCVATLSYLTKDMNWIPSYSLHLDYGTNTASLRMQATVIVDGADARDRSTLSADQQHHLMIGGYVSSTTDSEDEDEMEYEGEYSTDDDDGDDLEEETKRTKTKRTMKQVLGLVQEEEEDEKEENSSVMIRHLYLAGGNPTLSSENYPERFLEMKTSQFPSNQSSLFRGGANRLNPPPEMDSLSDCSSESEPMVRVPRPAAAQGGVPPEEVLASLAVGQDFVMYELENVRVAPRMALPVFNGNDLPFSDVYSVDLVLSDQPLTVKHSARVRNLSPLPWTSGPVITSSSRQLLVGQSTLRFTPPGRNVDVDLGTALSVRITYRTTVSNTRVIKKNRQARTILQELTVSGVARIINTRPTECTLLCSMAMNGRLQSSVVDRIQMTEEQQREVVERIEIEPATKTEQIVGGVREVMTNALWRIDVPGSAEMDLKVVYLERRQQHDF